MRFSYSILLLILLAVFYSCTDDQCGSDTEALLQTELIAIDVDDEFIDSLSLYSPEWADSIHYSIEGADNIISFMLSPNSDTTEIIYCSTNAALNDTIFIYYQREFIFLTPECGFVTDYFIDTVLYTYNYIDSIEIVTDEITTNADGYIQIYF
ncbi:DUF6452 family protein [Bacteroidota bacterium]